MEKESSPDAGCQLGKDIFHEFDLNKIEVITAYINFCSQQRKTRPTLPRLSRVVSNEACFEELRTKCNSRSAQREQNHKLNTAKRQNRQWKLERTYLQRNTKKLWATMKSIRNMTPTRKPQYTADGNAMPNYLTTFMVGLIYRIYFWNLTVSLTPKQLMIVFQGQK